jgi:hypothetical protein
VGNAAELERMDYLEFIAGVMSHIPHKGQVMVRKYGLYANAHLHPSPGVDVRGREAAASPDRRSQAKRKKEILILPEQGEQESLRLQIGIRRRRAETAAL